MQMEKSRPKTEHRKNCYKPIKKSPAIILNLSRQKKGDWKSQASKDFKFRGKERHFFGNNCDSINDTNSRNE